MLLLVLLLWLGSKGLLDLVAWHRPLRRKIPKDKKQKTDYFVTYRKQRTATEVSFECAHYTKRLALHAQ